MGRRSWVFCLFNSLIHKKLKKDLTRCAAWGTRRLNQKKGAIMLTLYIRNITKCRKISDYEYLVFVNEEKIAEGTLQKHARKDGWAVLIKKIAEQHIEKK